VNHYGPTPDLAGPERKYSVGECCGTHKQRFLGKPIKALVSTSYIQKYNQTMRQHMKRFARLTAGHSKKIDNHVHMVALYTCWYNFARISSVRMSPAMAVHLTERLGHRRHREADRGMGGTGMSRILTVAIFALMLAGCASGPGYDKSAVPDATAAMRHATAMCEKEQTASQFNASKFMACRVAAERNFAMAIDLPKMDAFDTYAAKMLALAADYDAGRIYLKRMGTRAASIRNDYLRACDCNLNGRPTYDYMSFVASPNPTTTDLGQMVPVP
jgi:hypothetical protein